MPSILIILLTLVAGATFATPAATAAELDLIRRGPAESPSVGSTTHTASTTDHTFGTARVAGALIAVVALILALKWGSQKFFGTAIGHRSSRAVELVGRNSVGPRQSVLLLRVGRRLLIVGDSAGSLNKLSEITDADEVAELVGQLRQDKPDSMTRTFGSLFKSAETDLAPAPGQDDSANHLTPDNTDDFSPNQDQQEMRDELAGLTHQVRSLSRQLGGAGA